MQYQGSNYGEPTMTINKVQNRGKEQQNHKKENNVQPKTDQNINKYKAIELQDRKRTLKIKSSDSI